MSQFEREIKNVLDNYEMPVDNGAWSNMEQKMDSGNRSSFYKQFVVAGVVLTTSLAFLTTDLNTKNTGHNDLIANNHSTESSNIVHQNNIQDDAITISVLDENGHVDINDDTQVKETKVIESNDQFVNSKNVTVKNKTLSAHEELNNLSAEEKSNLININKKIKEQSDNNLITEYVGKNFNLNANVILTPNGDNVQDVFIPEAIKEGDDFLMKIFNQNDEMIFSTSEIKNPWTGYNQVTGEMCETGNYQWKVTLDKDNRKEIFTGIIMVK